LTTFSIAIRIAVQPARLTGKGGTRMPHNLRTFAAAVSLCAAPLAAHAQDFYKGKTVTIVVGFTPGGGFDANARLLSRHLAGHIPGKPDVIVSNMPGAASMVAVNYLEASAPKDGTIVATFNYGQITASRLQPNKVKADFRNYSWIGSIAEDPEFCFLPKKMGVATFDQVKARGHLVLGITSSGTANDIVQRIMKSVLGVDLKQISGYPGSTEVKLAMERGEVDGTCGAWSEVPPDWEQHGEIVPYMNFGSFRPANMPKNVPFARDYAKTERDRAIIDALMGASIIGRPFIVSHSVPAERVAILRKAFDETVKDPAFLADAEKLRMPVSPKTAAEARAIVEHVYAAPDDVAQAARRIMEE
jgi:tripartite-type tricarboxylate transporter receptor subunit TctC